MGNFFRWRRQFVALVVLSVVHHAAHAQPPAVKQRLRPDVAAAGFGQRETIIDASLSPDGTKIATVQPNGARGSVLLILDLAKPDSVQVPILGASGDPERLQWCRWVSNTRLLCNFYQLIYLAEVGELSYVTRLTAIDADGKNMQTLKPPSRNGRAWGFSTFGGSVIDWDAGKEGHILLVSAYIPEFSTGTRISSKADGLGVDDVDTTNVRGLNVEKAKDRARDYVTDGHGRVRVMGLDAPKGADGYDSGIIRYSYRRKTGSEWLELGQLDTRSRVGFNPIAVDRDADVVYGLKKVNGRTAAYSVALDGSRKETELFARDDVDVDDFVTIGRNRRVIGVSYATDHNQVEYFDPKMKALVRSLSKAMPNLPLVQIADSSQDEQKLLIWASSDVDPGRYYLLDRKANAMEEVAVNRLPLEPVALATVKPISFTAADGTTVPAYLTLPPGSAGKNLPAIVMPHGGPSARDRWGFDWLAQYWAQIGYAVIQPNFRGSAGYGDSWFQNNGVQSWRVAIGDVTDAGRWLVKQGIADPKKLAIFGWSYGGYAALQSGVTAPDLFRAIVAVAPVTDFQKLREDRKNWSDYQVNSDFIGNGPHVREGSPAQRVSEIKAPVLIFHGTYDRNVSIEQSRYMNDRLHEAGKSVQLITYDKLDHYLDDSEARRDMLLKAAQFIEKAFAQP